MLFFWSKNSDKRRSTEPKVTGSSPVWCSYKAMSDKHLWFFCFLMGTRSSSNLQTSSVETTTPGRHRALDALGLLALNRRFQTTTTLPAGRWLSQDSQPCSGLPPSEPDWLAPS